MYWGKSQHFLCEKVPVLAVCALVLSGCDSWAPDQSVSAPTSDPTLTASMSVPVIAADGGTSSRAFILFDCSRNVTFTGPLDITMTVGQSVDLDQVEFRLIDTDGGQTRTNRFSDEDLESAFGSTRLAAGTVRTMRFHTDLPCRMTTQSVAADIRFVETSGRKNTATVTAPFVVCDNRTDRGCSL